MPDPPLHLPGYVDTIKYAGKLGHPSGLPGNKLLVTWGVGVCNTAANDVAGMVNLRKDGGDSPACDTGIYRTGELPAGTPNIIKHPSELVPIVNSPDFHEFLARPVVPYSAIFGVDHPKEIPRAELSSDPALEHGTPFGVLGASSIIHRETHPLTPVEFDHAQAADVGTDTIDYNDEELCGIRILAVNSNIGNGKQSYEWKSTSTVGERVEIIGEFPVRNWDADGKPVMDSLGMQDTSFKVRFPADTPYLMQGSTAKGAPSTPIRPGSRSAPARSRRATAATFTAPPRPSSLTAAPSPAKERLSLACSVRARFLCSPAARART